MTQLVAQVVERAIEGTDGFEDWGDLEFGEYIPGPNGTYGHHEPFKVTLDGETFELKVVDETGGMDEGSHASVTIQIGDQFFRKDGYYASHYGYDWDGAFYEVAPRQVTVTRYERINR